MPTENLKYCNSGCHLCLSLPKSRCESLPIPQSLQSKTTNEYELLHSKCI